MYFSPLSIFKYICFWIYFFLYLKTLIEFLGSEIIGMIKMWQRNTGKRRAQDADYFVTVIALDASMDSKRSVQDVLLFFPFLVCGFWCLDKCIEPFALVGLGKVSEQDCFFCGYRKCGCLVWVCYFFGLNERKHGFCTVRRLYKMEEFVGVVAWTNMLMFGVLAIGNVDWKCRWYVVFSLSFAFLCNGRKHGFLHLEDDGSWNSLRFFF